MASQHRRGGTHAVKDRDLTHTKYDDYNREQLLTAVKTAGCYVKDDKKSVMARKLAEHDRHKLHEERRAAVERKEKEEMRQQEINNILQAQRGRREARAKRNKERGIRYERGEDVSSNSNDTDEDQDRFTAHKLTVTGGEVLSDETWEDTCSETTIRSENPPVHPSCRLQILEWPYLNAPLESPTDLEAEQNPALLAYTPLKLLTITTREKITLPGKNYPAGVDPDFVPVLSLHTRAAARHGHMINQLSRAVIEPASLWAARTTVQGWNGHLYFSLHSRSHHDTKNGALADVYRKWHTANAKLLHPTPGVMDVESDRKNRFKQRANNKRRQAAEVCDASLWRPSALGYAPSYLDWEPGMEASDGDASERILENLWYVRYTGCDVPHYFFWSREGEWRDATKPDPEWSPEAFENQRAIGTTAHPSRNLQTGKYRVKKLTSLPTHDTTVADCFKPPLSCYENDLLTHRLFFTLAQNRAHAVAAGKEREWTTFTRQLLRLHPSGELPRAPPVQPEKGMCVVDKISALLAGEATSPYSGKEAWTRNDDAFWAIVEAVSHGDAPLSEAAVSTELPSPLSHADHELATNEGENALHRRDSVVMPPPHCDSEMRVWTWLDSISTTFPEPPTPLSPNIVGLDEPISPLESDTRNTAPTCPFCGQDWKKCPDWERAAHMLSHSHISPQPLTSTFYVQATGECAKRRYSLLSSRTLQSYHDKYGRRSKIVRIDSVRSIAGSVAESLREDLVDPLTLQAKKATRERSPFSKERRRESGMRRVIARGEGRGARGWMLERRQSDWGSQDAESDEDMDAGWEGDDERNK